MVGRFFGRVGRGTLMGDYLSEGEENFRGIIWGRTLVGERLGEW